MGASALAISPACGGEDASFGIIARAGIPAMQVLRRVETRADPFFFAAPDYLAGGRMAGYLEGLASLGGTPLILPERASRLFGREAVGVLSNQYPKIDAAMCFNDLVALGMQSGLADLGRAAGSDFRLVGFDDIEDCALVFPALSSAGCNIAGFRARVAAPVLVWLQDRKLPLPELRTKVDLIVRRSRA